MRVMLELKESRSWQNAFDKIPKRYIKRQYVGNEDHLESVSSLKLKTRQNQRNWRKFDFCDDENFAVPVGSSEADVLLKNVSKNQSYGNFVKTHESDSQVKPRKHIATRKMSVQRMLDDMRSQGRVERTDTVNIPGYALSSKASVDENAENEASLRGLLRGIKIIKNTR